MSPRRSRVTKGEVALVVAIVVGIAYALYAIARALVGVIAWIIRSRSKPSTATTSRAAVGPKTASNRYRPVIAVEPSVFDDPARTRESAHRAFAAWASQIPKAPRDASDLIRRVEVRTRVVGRLQTRLEGRRIVWRSQPYRGREAASLPPLDAATVNAWQPPPDLRGKSRYVAMCPTCHGDGRVSCSSCAGSGRSTCGACNGAGKFYGTAANGAHRLLNCKTCRGKGDVVCGGCTRGRVECASCQRSKKLECWLEVDTSHREDVQVEPDGDVTKAYAWGQDGVEAADDEVSRDARVIGSMEQPRMLTIGELPSYVPDDWRQASWEPIRARIDPSERVIAQRLTMLELPSTDVIYGIGRREQRVSFEGRRMLAPTNSVDDVLHRRARSLSRAKWLLAAIPIAAGTAYAARGDYFFDDYAAPLVGGVTLSAVALAVLGYVSLWYATLRRRAGRRWLFATFAPLPVAATLAWYAEPSVAHARASIAKHDLDAARVELAALGNYEDANLVPVWADLHLDEVLAASDCSTASTSARLIDPRLPQRGPAQARVDQLAQSETNTLVASARYDAAAAALECGSEALRTSAVGRELRARIAIGQAEACQARESWTCAVAKANEAAELGLPERAAKLRNDVFELLHDRANKAIASATTEKDLDRRVTREHDALSAWSSYESVALPEAADPPALLRLRQRTTSDEQALAKQQKAEQAKRQAEEKRRQAAAEHQRRIEEERESRRMSEPEGLLCCDGSISPSCSCGGSHRGCCSHHGGVCGCQ
jgi:hypothetical protein